MVKTERLIQVEIKSATQLREWLEQNHIQKDSAWLLLYKKSYGKYYFPKQDVLDELLCFGWIDGMARKVGDDTYLLLASPRRIEPWAESYKKRIKILETEGRMSDAGIKAVQQSKQNGNWHFMEDVDVLVKPQDFIKCLEENPLAMVNFDAFGASSKRFMLRYIKIAKTAETRAQQITKITLLAKEGKKLKSI